VTNTSAVVSDALNPLTDRLAPLDKLSSVQPHLRQVTPPLDGQVTEC